MSDTQMNSFIYNVNILVKHLKDILLANTYFDQDVIDVLEKLQGLNLKTVIEDLEKNAYLGNRKLDIDLNKNILDNTKEAPYYDKAKFVFTDGTSYVLNFDAPYNSHADISFEFRSDAFIKSRVDLNTIISAPSVDGNANDDLIRVLDEIGIASVIENITLFINTSRNTNYNQVSSVYSWMDTTSAIIVLANRASEILALSLSLPQFNTLYDNLQQLLEIQLRIPQLIDTYDSDGNPNGDVTIYNKLKDNTLIEVYNNLTAIQGALQNSLDAAASASLAKEYAEQIKSQLDTYATTTKYGVMKFVTDAELDKNLVGLAGGIGLVPDAYQVGQRLYTALQKAGTNTYGNAKMAEYNKLNDYAIDDPVFVTPYTLTNYVAENSANGSSTSDGGFSYSTTAGLMLRRIKRPKVVTTDPDTFAVEVWGRLVISTASPVRIMFTGNISSTYITVSGSVDSPTTTATVRRDPTTGVNGQNYVDVGIWNGTSWIAGTCVADIKVITDNGALPAIPQASLFTVMSPSSGTLNLQLK